MMLKEVRELFLCRLCPGLESSTRTSQPQTRTETIDLALAHESNWGLRDPKVVRSESQKNETATIRLTSADASNIANPGTEQQNNGVTILICDFGGKQGQIDTECRFLHRKFLSESTNLQHNFNHRPTVKSPPRYQTNSRNFHPRNNPQKRIGAFNTE